MHPIPENYAGNSLSVTICGTLLMESDDLDNWE